PCPRPGRWRASSRRAGRGGRGSARSPPGADPCRPSRGANGRAARRTVRKGSSPDAWRTGRRRTRDAGAGGLVSGGGRRAVGSGGGRGGGGDVGALGPAGCFHEGAG